MCLSFFTFKNQDYDDLAACLKEEGANVERYECIGSHGVSMVFDSKNNNKKFVKA